GEVVDDEELGAAVAPQRAFELTVELGAGQLVEHAGGAGGDDAASGLARAVGERPGEEGLSSAGDADEERIDARGEKAEGVQREIGGAELFCERGEIEIEAVDGVELGVFCVLDTALDGALHPAGTLLVAQAMNDVE